MRPAEAEKATAGEATPLPGAPIAHTAGRPSGAITEATVSAQGAGEEGPSGAAGAAGKAPGPLALRQNATTLFLNRKALDLCYVFII